jgi:uncharacterized protein
MKLSLETINQYYQIHSYDDDKVIVRAIQQHTDNIELTTSFILMPEQLITDCSISNIASLTEDEVAYLISLEAEVILMASASSELNHFSQTQQQFSSHGIGVELLSLSAACRTYNLLTAEDRQVLLLINFQ